jgi:hypothetical protein
MFCLNPPLDSIPAGDWLCPICLQAKSDASALRLGTEMSWAEFEKSANAAKRMYWGGDARARKVGFARTLPYFECQSGSLQQASTQRQCMNVLYQGCALI